MTVVKDLEASNTSVVSVQVVSDSLNIVGAFIENIKSLFDVVPDKKVNLVKTYMISAPFTVPHLFWGASVAPQNTLPISFDCLLDNGSHLVLIHTSLVKQLDLHLQKLPSPIEIKLTMQNKKEKVSVILTEYVHLFLHDSTGEYSAWTVHVIVAPNLYSPVILGLLFLKHNKIVVDHDQ